jgi:hypothetical protein
MASDPHPLTDPRMVLVNEYRLEVLERDQSDLIRLRLALREPSGTDLIALAQRASDIAREKGVTPTNIGVHTVLNVLTAFREAVSPDE